MPLLLSEKDVRAVLSMDDLIDTMDTALAQFSSGQVEQPLRTVVVIGGKSFYGVMPAFIQQPAALGSKLVYGLRIERRTGAADPPCDDPAVRPRDG